MSGISLDSDIVSCQIAGGITISLDAVEFSAAMATMPEGTDAEAVSHMGDVVRSIGWVGESDLIPDDVRDTALVGVGIRVGKYLESLGNESGSRPN